uniref:Uncharacterized protein n=1 Tax=Anopheles farauti TaxID=69004 RepID=A0A182QPF4_9DIPT
MMEIMNSRCIVEAFNWLAVNFSDKSALSFNVVFYSSFVTIGIDQVVFALGGVVLTSFLLSVNITGVIIMDIVVIFVVRRSMMLLIVMVMGHIMLYIVVRTVVILSTSRCH